MYPECEDSVLPALSGWEGWRENGLLAAAVGHCVDQLTRLAHHHGPPTTTTITTWIALNSLLGKEAWRGAETYFIFIFFIFSVILNNFSVTRLIKKNYLKLIFILLLQCVTLYT